MSQGEGGGRPTKLTDEFLAAAEKVLADGDEVIICTDYELVILINEQLPEEQRIGKRTFETWKASLREGEEPDENLRRFQRLIEKALVREKAALFKNLREARQPGSAGLGSSSGNSMSGTSSGRSA
jgi:hypothetical protein